ncbi:MAG: hypothetical protein ACKVPJ_13300 [Chitinophagales bacterium]
MSDRSYPSKLLLFGEYAVVLGGEALAIPYYEFSAKWIFNTGKESGYKNHLLNFLTFLKQNNFAKTIDITAFEKDLHSGLDLESTIPIGYGVGSSGVVVAAVYDKYAFEKIDAGDLPALKSFLGEMENYFHKKSSGLDPLVCYLQKPLHIKSNSAIEILQDVSLENDEFKIKLWDSDESRTTYKMMQVFKEKIKDDGFKKVIEQEYLRMNTRCIKQFLPLDLKNFIYSLTQLSIFQYDNFQFAITEDMQRIWKHELDWGKRLFKLCGAGGGGFYTYFDLE